MVDGAIEETEIQDCLAEAGLLIGYYDEAVLEDAMRKKLGPRLANANPLVAPTLNKLLRRGDSIDGLHWNIMGQVYFPKSITEECFSWHALLPSDTLVPTIFTHASRMKELHVISP